MNKYRANLSLVVIILFSVAYPSFAGEGDVLVCGAFKISVSPAAMQGDEKLQDFRMTIVSGNRSKTLIYDAENEYLDIRCEKNREGNPKLLVNHWCGGSGCSSGNWGIVDLSTFEVLLLPDSRWKGNHDRAEALLGKKIELISCDTEHDARCYRSRDE